MNEHENTEYIYGVIEKKLTKHLDFRGNLIETFRIDELPKDITPVMSYVSLTQPGYWRGPHVHKERTEIFAFPGPGNFRIILWDNREDSETYLKRKIIFGGEDSPTLLVISPGIVHVVENISKSKETSISIGSLECIHNPPVDISITLISLIIVL